MSVLQNQVTGAAGEAGLPGDDELLRRLSSVPDTIAARFNWQSGQVVQKLGRENSQTERRLAVLWLAVTYGYGSMNWAARLLGLSADGLRSLFDARGFGQNDRATA